MVNYLFREAGKDKLDWLEEILYRYFWGSTGQRGEASQRA